MINKIIPSVHKIYWWINLDSLSLDKNQSLFITNFQSFSANEWAIMFLKLWGSLYFKYFSAFLTILNKHNLFKIAFLENYSKYTSFCIVSLNINVYYLFLAYLSLKKMRLHLNGLIYSHKKCKMAISCLKQGWLK